MSAGVQDLFIELIGVLDWLISAFLGTLRNVWPSAEEVWDLWFNLGSHAKAKDLSHLPLDQTGKSSILICGVVLGLQQDVYSSHAMQMFFSFGLMRFFYLESVTADVPELNPGWQPTDPIHGQGPAGH